MIRVLLGAIVIALSIAVPAASAEPQEQAAPQAKPETRATPESCPYARLGLSYYRGTFIRWQLRREASVPTWRKPRNCADARYLASVWAERSRASRAKTLGYLGEMRHRTLRDFAHSPGSHAWKRAVREVQRAYPGTESWLMSCSASEGGWGRWVPNSQGSGVGGWLQFMPGTWAGFYRHAVDDVRARGFIVPPSSASWYSTLGQALAGAWGITHGMRHHWAGAGCW